MADQIRVLANPASSISYTIPGTAVVTPLAAVATFNGAGAAGAFLPCLSFYNQQGELLGRYTSEESVAAGDTAVVSYGPSLRPKPSASTGGALAAAVLSMNDTIGAHNQTVTALGTITVPWFAFATTDSTVFATGTASTVNNTAGDTVLYCQQNGLYLLETWLVWSGALISQTVTLTSNHMTGLSTFPWGGANRSGNTLANSTGILGAGGQTTRVEDVWMAIADVQPEQVTVSAHNGNTTTSNTVTTCILNAFYFGTVSTLASVYP
jgi:hypothetical protein